jgi:hypothetical protein
MADEFWFIAFTSYDSYGNPILGKQDASMGLTPNGAVRHVYCNACGTMVAPEFLEDAGMYMNIAP